jgi:hypothetical protein
MIDVMIRALRRRGGIGFRTSFAERKIAGSPSVLGGRNVVTPAELVRDGKNVKKYVSHFRPSNMTLLGEFFRDVKRS